MKLSNSQSHQASQWWNQVSNLVLFDSQIMLQILVTFWDAYHVPIPVLAI